MYRTGGDRPILQSNFGKTLAEHTATYGRIDVVAGGFPCQDVSLVGRRAGIERGTRSGLWFEFFRIIRIVRPRYVLLENVAGLLSMGFGRVLGDLASIGYDAEWQCLRASDFGYLHSRKRVFIIAYPNGVRCDFFENVISRKQKRLSPSKIQSHTLIVCSCGRIFAIPDSSDVRMLDGVPDALDRYKSLGNAVVPHCAGWIAKRILDLENQK